MKLTEIERTIIVVNIIGVILDEYKADEITTPIKNLKDKCLAFAKRQSGTDEKIVRGRHTVMIVDAKRHKRYLDSSMIGDKIWRESVDHYAKQKLSIDAVALIEAVYLFNEKIILKHTTIKREDLDAYRYEHTSNDYTASVDGTAIGGHLMGLMMRECGVEVNGKLRALRLRVQDQVGAAA